MLIKAVVVLIRLSCFAKGFIHSTTIEVILVDINCFFNFQHYHKFNLFAASALIVIISFTIAATAIVIAIAGELINLTTIVIAITITAFIVTSTSYFKWDIEQDLGYNCPSRELF